MRRNGNQERELEEKRRARRRAEMAQLETYHSPQPPQVQRQLVRRLEPVRSRNSRVACFAFFVFFRLNVFDRFV